MLAGLPALGTLVAVAQPPCHVAHAAAPTLAVCLASDIGPWSTALAFVILSLLSLCSDHPIILGSM